MQILLIVKSRLVSIFQLFLKASLVKKLIVIVVIGTVVWFSRSAILKSKKQTVQYETTTAEKGTLITSISASGSITSSNNTNITTKVSGITSKVYVTNGDKVTKGQKIADIALDDYAKERQTTAWVTYLEATEAVKEAITAKATADIQMWKDRQAVLDAQKAIDDKKANDTNPATHAAYTDGERMIIDKTIDQTRKAFSVSESKYQNADADISAARAKVAAALRNYQENSATIIAPAAGTMSDLALAPGLIINASSSTSNTSGATIVSNQTIGKIKDAVAQLIATITLPEADIIKVKANQKVTLTLDAYSDKTFTGKVLAVNTSGSVSSGVTSYPVTILLDPVSVEIYPNMAVSVEIITDIKNDVISVSTTAITTTNNQSTVQVKKGSQVSTVIVETGISNDSQTEIISGLSEGDEVVTSTIATDTGTTATNTTTSPFSGLSRTSGGSNTSGGNFRMRDGGPGGF